MRKILAVIKREIREAVPATLFFLWLFHMVALTKAVTLGDYSFTALRATFATVGALLVAKAILIVEALPLSRLFASRLWLQILWKALLFNVVVLAFRFLEELFPLLAKHESLAVAVAQLYDHISWPYFWVFHAWISSTLLIYCAAAELFRAWGVENVKAALFDRRRATENP